MSKINPFDLPPDADFDTDLSEDFSDLEEWIKSVVPNLSVKQWHEYEIAALDDGRFGREDTRRGKALMAYRKRKNEA